MNTIETLQTPSYDEYGIVATFSDESLHSLSLIQTQLSEHLGEAIWLTPRRALHSTLMEIVCDKDYGNTPRSQVFSEWFENYSSDVAEVLANIPYFDITFTELEVSNRAIIVKLADSQIFNDIRSKILEAVRLPEGTKLPPDITHCSLARFNTATDLDDVRSRAKDIKVNFTENITEFKLLKDLGPPDFDPKLVASFPLNS